MPIAATKIAKNPIQYMKPNRNYIKNNLDDGVIKITNIKSVDQLVDIMTHGIIGNSFHISLKFDICDKYD